MPRESFNEELNSLHHDLIRMGGAVEKQIDIAITALVNQDGELAQKVIDGDDMIDDMQTDIEAKCVKLIAKQQPLAIDLRRIFTAAKLVTDLERIADYAVDIARITIRLKDEIYMKPIIDIPRMAEIAQTMIKNALDAYVNLDAQKAEETSKMDDQIDEIYRSIFNELIGIMKKDSSTIIQGTQFMFISKFLERTGDHVTNVCEWIVYLVTGEHKVLND